MLNLLLNNLRITTRNNKKFSQLRGMKQWEFKLETSLGLGLHLEWIVENVKYNAKEDNFI